MEASRGTRSKCFDSTQRGGCRFRGGPRPGTALSFIQVLHWCVVFLFVLPGCATWRGRFVEYQHVCHGGTVAMGRCGASGCGASERGRCLDPMRFCSHVADLLRSLRGSCRPISISRVLRSRVVFLFVSAGCATWRGRFVEYQHVCHGGAVAMGRCGASGCDVSERDVNAPILRSEGLSRHQQDALLPCPTPHVGGWRPGWLRRDECAGFNPLCRRLMVIPGLPRSRGGSVNSGADPGAKNAPGNSSSDGMSVLRRAFERRSEHVAPRPRYPIRWPRPR